MGIDLRNSNSYSPLQDNLLEESSSLADIVNAAEKRIVTVEDESGQQNIEIVCLPDRDSQKTVIVPVAWSDYPSRQFNLLRQAEAARAMQAEVLIVGFPGMSPDIKQEDSQLTPLQLEELNSNEPSLKAVSDKLWDALLEAIRQTHNVVDPLQYLQNRRVNILGYSQGASVAAGMLAAKPDHLMIHSVAYVELADRMQPESKAKVFGRFAVDGMSAGKYYKENRENYPDMPETHKSASFIYLTRRFIGETTLRLMPQVFAKSSVRRDLKAAHQSGHLGEVSGHLVRRGSASRVSSQEAADKLVNILRDEADAYVGNDEFTGDNHSFQESLARYRAASVNILGSL